MVREGAAAFSLRAVARVMGVTAPALYRYFPNRDALVTALIVDAYQELAERMEAASERMRAADYGGRWQGIARAYRQWAIANREDYSLIYGTPIPGYDAPREQMIEPAARVLRVIGCLLHDSWQAGRLLVDEVYGRRPAGLEQAVIELRGQLSGTETAAEVVLLTLLTWSRLHGLVWGELYEHFPPGMADSGELFEVEIEGIGSRLGFFDE
jgi:AcrR family transcriptional regulator